MNPPNPDLRLQTLATWLQSLPAYRFDVHSLKPASSDASFRRYFRVWDEHSQTHCVVMDAPPDKEDTQPFLQVARALDAAGVRVPKVLTTQVEQGFLLLQDFGSQTFLQALHAKEEGAQSTHADALYRQALSDLVHMQAQAPVAGLMPYSAEKLHQEMALFGQWYVGTHHQSSLSVDEHNALQSIQNLLVKDAQAQGQVFVHRDYHSRNLMVLPEERPEVRQETAPLRLGMLDFQDAVHGPIAYDVVSLLRDAYVQWPEEQTLDWAIRYWQEARQKGLPVPANVDAFYQQFDFIGLQRHLKVLGIFARLYHRDGKSGYLADLPVVLAYVRQVAKRYGVFKPLLHLLDRLEGQAPAVGLTF